jgi:agmatinase
MSYSDLYVSSSPMLTYPNKESTIQVLGVPFDSTSTYRPGSRFAPNAIREAFLNIELYSPKFDLDLDNVPINDLGNLIQIADAKKMSEIVQKVISENYKEKKTPIILGGEHTISYATFSCLPKDTALIVFDAHLDLRDEFAECKFSHTTWLRRYVEEKGSDNLIHLGYRAISIEEINYLKNEELKSISTEEIFNSNKSEDFLADLLFEFEKVYISIDMDILDPAYAPGVGNPEAAGISTVQLLNILGSIQGKKILGFDITEVCPPYDTGITSIAAARTMIELLSIMQLSNNNEVRSRRK